MKQLFLIILITLFSFNVNSQNYQQIEEIPEEGWQEVVDKYGQKAIDGFNSVVDTVTPIAMEGFEIAVRLQIAKGLVGLIPIILFFMCIYRFNKNIKKGNYENYKWDRYATLSIIYGMCSIVLFIISASTIYETITHLIAPEWYAIKDIISLFK